MRGRNRRIAFALAYPDVVLNDPDMRPAPPSTRYYPRELLRPGYLRRGYGGTKEWPFDKEKAFQEPGYQRGIRRAVRNPAYSLAWRQAAARLLEEVDEMEEAERERRIYDAENEAIEEIEGVPAEYSRFRRAWPTESDEL